MERRRVIPPKKLAFCDRMRELFTRYSRCLLVNDENVNATQLLHIRHDVQGIAEIVFGKNSLMQRAAKEIGGPLDALVPYLKGGVGLVFTAGPFIQVKEIIDRNCVGSPARVGAISPVDVTIPPMKTTLPPTQVSVLHALNIQSKIFKGTIEITSEKQLIKTGDKVGASEANLLSLLGIQPFRYTLTIEHIYDTGHVYDPVILGIGDNVLAAKFGSGLRAVTGLSVAIGYPNQVSVSHLVGAAFKNVASVAVVLDIQLRQIADVQALLADPEALAKLAAEKAAAEAAAPVAAPAAAPNAAKEEVKEEEAALELADGFDDLFG
jgi:large subunit ribosomal protein LP0